MKAYTLSLTAKTLTITKAFEEAVATGKGAEYKTYMRLMQEIPGLTIVRKTHRTPAKYHNKNGETTSRNQFKNITYDNMERFIAALPNCGDYLTQYDFLRTAAARLQINGYSMISKWFMAQFPQFRSNPMVYLTENVAVVPASQFLQEMEKRKEQKEAVAALPKAANE